MYNVSPQPATGQPAAATLPSSDPRVSSGIDSSPRRLRHSPPSNLLPQKLGPSQEIDDDLRRPGLAWSGDGAVSLVNYLLGTWTPLEKVASLGPDAIQSLVFIHYRQHARSADAITRIPSKTCHTQLL
ncbi:hypothetical protein FRC08_003457 [Ceratobasidium sp. 394]|nr:hypothetical protein FRC08_003457 [Ceratobasidium sp. 394]